MATAPKIEDTSILCKTITYASMVKAYSVAIFCLYNVVMSVLFFASLNHQGESMMPYHGKKFKISRFSLGPVEYVVEHLQHRQAKIMRARLAQFSDPPKLSALK